MAHIHDLLGQTLSEVKVVEQDIILFTLTTGEIYEMGHDQECCEQVYIESIVGDLQDLVGHPILLAEESTSEDENTREERQQWTFYKLATIKGYVDIRWNGSSNGYYSVSVDFNKLP